MTFRHTSPTPLSHARPRTARLSRRHSGLLTAWLRPTILGLALLPLLAAAQTGTPDKTTWQLTLDRIDDPRDPYFGRTRSVGPNPQPTGAAAKTLGATLFAYGTAAGDSSLSRSDDLSASIQIGATGPEGTTPVLPVFGQNYGTFYINNNGSLSFGGAVGDNYSNLQTYRGHAVVAPFWADVDTRATIQDGNYAAANLVRHRTVQSTSELAAIGARIAAAAPGLTTFAPTFAEVVTWDHVGNFSMQTAKPNMFQVVIASDGLQTYTLFLYPNRAIWWDRGTASPADSFAAVGVTDGTGNLVMEATGSGTAGVRDLWFLSNAEDGAAGTQVFQINNSTATLTVNGLHTLPTTQGTAVTTLTFADNPAGHTVTSSTVAGSILFNALRFANPANSATFADQTVVLTNAADAIIQGNLTFADNTVLTARVANAVNGGTLTFQKEAKLALYAANATTAATTLRFDSTAGGTGGRFDLAGFDTTVGGLSSIGPSAGVITNSGPTLATLTSSFNTATHTFGGVLQNGTASLGLAKAGTGTLALTGANTFTGGVRLSGGTLQLGSAQALGSAGSLVFTGGTLQFSAANTTDYSARFSTAANQSFRFDTNSQNVALATALTVAGGSLTKLGAGTLTLGAGATYNGATVVRGGTLSASAANAFSPNSALFIVDGANVSLGGHAQTVGDLDSYDAITANYYSPGTVNLGGATLTNLNRVTNNWGGALTGTGTFIKQGSATMNWAGTNTFTGMLQIDAGTVSTQSAGTLSPNATVTLASGAALNLNGGPQTIAGLSGAGTVSLGSGQLHTNQAGDSTFSGVISGGGTVVKSGAGTLTLNGANTYSGGTTISFGTVATSHTAALGTGPVAVSAAGAVLALHGTVLANTVNLTQGGSLSGSGGVGSLSASSGGRISPGDSPGLLTAGATTFGPSGNYTWEINDAASPATSAGTRYDLLSISGSLTITATSGSPFTIHLTSLLADHSPGHVINFNSSVNSSYTVATASGGIVDFSADKFSLNTTGFTNPLNGGSWSLGTSGNDLNLTFTASAIPEPGTYAAVLGVSALALAAYRRRRS